MIASGLQNTIGGLVVADKLNAGYPAMVAFRRLLDRIQRLLDTNGGDLRVLGERFLPHAKAIAGALMNFDPSQIMANILATLPEDGVVTLHMNVLPSN
jgi:hypothetical protein